MVEEYQPRAEQFICPLLQEYRSSMKPEQEKPLQVFDRQFFTLKLCSTHSKGYCSKQRKVFYNTIMFSCVPYKKMAKEPTLKEAPTWKIKPHTRTEQKYRPLHMLFSFRCRCSWQIRIPLASIHFIWANIWTELKSSIEQHTQSNQSARRVLKFLPFCLGILKRIQPKIFRSILDFHSAPYLPPSAGVRSRP